MSHIPEVGRKNPFDIRSLLCTHSVPLSLYSEISLHTTLTYIQREEYAQKSGAVYKCYDTPLPAVVPTQLFAFSLRITAAKKQLTLIIHHTKEN